MFSISPYLYNIQKSSHVPMRSVIIQKLTKDGEGYMYVVIMSNGVQMHQSPSL